MSVGDVTFETPKVQVFNLIQAYHPQMFYVQSMTML